MWLVSATIARLVSEGVVLAMLLHVLGFSVGRLFGLIRKFMS